MRRICVLIVFLAIAIAVPLGFSQDSGNGTSGEGGTSSKSSASGTAAAAANVNQTSISRTNFIGAAPGNIPAIFPGMAPGEISCSLYDVAALPPLTDAVIDSMAKHGKIPRGDHVTVIDPGETPYVGPIGLMQYNPRDNNLHRLRPNDIILASVIIPGAPSHTDEQLLGVVAKALKKAAPGMGRIAIINCPLAKNVTKGHTWGLGGAFSETPGGGNAANGSALGFAGGTSATGTETYSDFYAYALNQGPIDVPSPPVMQIPPPPPPPPPPVKQAPAPVPAPPPKVVVEKVPVDICKSSFPEETMLHFGFNNYFVFSDPKYRSENQSRIEKVRGWLTAYPMCNVEIVGFADHVGSYHFNQWLGNLRAKQVYEILAKDTAIKNQLLIVAPYTSAGKDFSEGKLPGKENWQDRKVVFVAVSATSKD